MTQPSDDSIGPYYRYAGIFLFAMFGLTVGTFLAAILFQVPLDSLVVKVLAGMAAGEMFAALLIIIRDKRFDSLFKTFVSALPFTKYQKPETSS